LPPLQIPGTRTSIAIPRPGERDERQQSEPDEPASLCKFAYPMRARAALPFNKFNHPNHPNDPNAVNDYQSAQSRL
jgi:hypothetical protein